MGVFEQFPYTNFHELNLNWIIEKVKEALSEIADLETLRDNFADLEAYVQNYFDNLDVSQEISDKIDEMVADGTMGNLIENVVTERMVKNQDLHLCRTGRLLDRFDLENRNKVLYGQSCCYLEGKYYTCGNEPDDSVQHVTIWNNQGIVVNTNSYTALGHANDITAIGNYLAVATAFSSRTIGLIDRTTLSLLSMITAPAGYDINSFYGVTDDGVDLIAIGGKSNGKLSITKISDFDTIPLFSEIAEITKPVNITPQTCCYYDGNLYLTYTQSNMIYKVNLQTKAIETAYVIPDGDGFNPLGEVEKAFVMNDDIYIFSPTGEPENMPTGATSVSTFCQIFKTDILHIVENNVSQIYRPDKLYTLVVDEDMTYSFNPNGTYSTIEEACVIANYVKKVNGILITKTTRGIFWCYNRELFVYSSATPHMLSYIYTNNASVRFNTIDCSYVNARSNSRITTTAGVFNGVLSVVNSEMTLVRATLQLTSLYLERGNLKIVSPFSIALASGFTNVTSSNSGNSISYHGIYWDDAMKLLRNTNDLLVKAYRDADLSTVRYTNSQIAGTTVITTALANSIFDSLVYNNYTFRLMESGNARQPIVIEIQTV